MNKKLFLGMFAAAGMLLATSCSNDELDMVQSGNEAQVTFNLGTEGAIATRAISDGLSAKKLVCAIYDANETLLDKVVMNGKQVDANGQYVNEEAFQGGLTDQVKVTLAKGQEYTMVFWAQNEACKAYTTTDLKAVKVSYKAENGTDNASNNDDTRDAFYAAETFKVEGNKEINVTLKRPFAQVNVGVYKSDWEAAEASGITIKESSVVIKNVADEINLLTGAVKASDAMENGITYALTAIPNDPAILKADANKDGEDEEYQWLSMSYILVNDIDASVDENGLLGTDRALLEGLQFTFKPESGQSITFEEGLAGAPVRRNWRTNILGKILTGDIQFNITIDNEFEDDYIYPDGTAEQELKFAAAFGGTVTLSDNVTLTEPLNVTADMVLNLGNYTISGNFVKDAGAVISNSATLKIVGGTIKNTAENGDAAINNSGNLVLNGVNIEGAPISALEGYSAYTVISSGEMTIENDTEISADRGCLKLSGTGETVINNGTFTNNDITRTLTSHVVDVEDGGSHKLTINGGTFNHLHKNTSGGVVICNRTTGTVYVNGGNFSGGNYYGNDNLSDYGYGGNFSVTGGTFSVEPKAEYVKEGYTSQAIAEDKWMVLPSNATVVTPTNITSMTFDGDNVTYTFVGDFGGEVTITAAGSKNLTFDGSAATFGNHIKFTANRIADNKNEITVERNGSYTFRGFKTNNSIAFGSCAVKSLKIEDCEAYMMYLNITNSNVTATGNKIVRPTTAEDTYKRYDGATQKDIIQVYADNYSLTLTDNTICDEKGVGNNLEVYGNYEQFQISDVTWTNSITVTGNTVTNSSQEIPLVKIYNDVTYAPVNWPEDYVTPNATKTLAKQLKTQNILEGGSCVVSIKCRANGKEDADVSLNGNEQ